MYTRVYVEITNICNMHCSFCHGHSRQLQRMDREMFARVLEQLQGQTEYIYYHLMGEPLTHPELPLFLKMAAQAGFRSVITTNGTLLQKRGTEILSAGLHKVSISLHSFEQGEESQYRQYLQEVADFADRATRAGVLVSLRLWNKGCDEGRNEKTVSFFREYFRKPWTENSRGYRIRDKLYLEWGERFSWPDKDAPLQGQKVFCYGMRDHFGILCDGTVVPCCLDSDGVIALGNIAVQDIVQILNTPRAKAIKSGFDNRTPSEDLCRRCGYAQRFS